MTRDRYFGAAAVIALIVLFGLARSTDTGSEAASRIVAAVIKPAMKGEAPGSGVFVLETPRNVPPRATPTSPAKVTPPAFPYSVLGKLTENDQPVVILYGSGRTLKVRGAGVLDESYEVDALLDRTLLVRHIPTGAQLAIGLAPPTRVPTIEDTGDTAQD